MARRHHHNSISLFPFLAVLVCAMGSLILLLLVMTRKIRNDQRSEVEAPVVHAEAAPVPPDRSHELAELQSSVAALQEQIARDELAAESLRQSLDARTLRAQQLRAEIAGEQSAEASNQTADLTASLNDTKSEIAELQELEVTLRAQLTEREAALLRKRQLLGQAEKAAADATRVLHEKNSALVSLRAQVDRAEKTLARSDGTATLLEFTNPSGTSRTPIVIDVSARGYELLPGGPVITPKQMEDFPIRDNPLLSTVLAAHRHRSKNSVVDEPYVLLLVRPDGCLPFYGAQRILTEAHIHHGYELLTPDRKVVTGEADASELPVVRSAIADALKRRDELYSTLLAMAQGAANNMGDGTPNGTATGRNGATRGLTIRPDGRVINEDRSAEPLPGRFYAGGEAPSAAHMRHRPAGGYGNVAARPMTTEDAEKLADEFAERYAAQREAAEQIPGVRRLDAALHDDPKVADETYRPVDADRSPDATPDEDFVPLTPEEAFLARSFTTVESATQQSRNRLSDIGVAAPRAKFDPLADRTTADISRADPDLLSRLTPSKSATNTLSSPVGIVVFLDDKYLTVAQQPAVEVSEDRLNAALAVLLQGINREVEDVRRSPTEPLMPIVKFVVSPGGERWRIPLSRELKSIGIHSATVYELTPYITVSDPAGRAQLDGETP